MTVPDWPTGNEWAYERWVDTDTKVLAWLV